MSMDRDPEAKRTKSSREKADHKDQPSEARCKSNYIELEFFKALSTPSGGSLLLYCLSFYKLHTVLSICRVAE